MFNCFKLFLIVIVVMNLNNRIFFYVQKKAAHSMRLCAAFVAANLLIFFTFRPFVWGGVNLNALFVVSNMEAIFSKSGAKVRIFFDICK